MCAEPFITRPPVTLHVLAKAPLPGCVKTRLIPLLGEQGAADAHAELVHHCVTNACQALPAEHVTLWTALKHQHRLFTALSARLGVTLKPQPEGDLGTRMRHALRDAPGPAMVMGSDCPSITSDLITTCAQQLTTHNVVILPAEDGGYGLIGTQDDYPTLFSDMPWGSEHVFAETCARLTASRLTARYPKTIWDVDRPEDWQRWRHIRHRQA
ncbi:TIGR04282 family arsenosugar biosynthesis glycosyltransferase [Halomonas llamarensis]|uniref:TIGR04282 family arsenosugar biosynthesis glycosyltransferase n=1 Tax=Halomonas llamarensis TaxID=2945104 RepID=A0ABT0SNU0_9GAMM|nr:TIGR04282 family arsenosugar biosynthesis glycosyltransferase [Halomonas llamarensis]MCL7929407.1 TIGR04282 family arsenosugar biosynthesis glycosyltransferase [Halomonas llamarensis]